MRTRCVVIEIVMTRRGRVDAVTDRGNEQTNLLRYRFYSTSSLKDGHDDDDDDFFSRALWTRVYDADACDATRGFPRGSRRWRLEGDGGDQAEFGEQPGR